MASFRPALLDEFGVETRLHPVTKVRVTNDTKASSILIHIVAPPRESRPPNILIYPARLNVAKHPVAAFARTQVHGTGTRPAFLRMRLRGVVPNKTACSICG